MTFKTTLADGKLGESEIVLWLRRRGNHCLPVYEIADGQFKGPTIYMSDNTQLIAPDILVFGKQRIFFVEAKHKEAFTMHRITNRWVTGIDLHHYEQYQLVQETLGITIWLLFLHKGGIAKDSPPSPSGLYGNNLIKLMDSENHRYTEKQQWCPHGMVFWAIDKLIKFAEYPLNP